MLNEKAAGWLLTTQFSIKFIQKKIEGTYFQWSGKHHKVIKGIGLITLIWTDGIVSFPIDYRIYDKKLTTKPKMIISRIWSIQPSREVLILYLSCLTVGILELRI